MRPGEQHSETHQDNTRPLSSNDYVDFSHGEHLHVSLDEAVHLIGDVSNTGHRVQQSGNGIDLRSEQQGSRRELFSSVIGRIAPKNQKHEEPELHSYPIAPADILQPSHKVLEVPLLEVEDKDNGGTETTPRDSGSITRRDLLTWAGGAVCLGYIGFQINRAVNRIGFPNINIDIPDAGSKPPFFESAVKPELYKYEETPGTFEMVSNSKVGAAVDITGHKDGVLWGVFGATDAHYDKVVFVDYLLSTDQARLNNSLIVERLGGKVTGVRATLNAMDVFQPRVDFLDFRNHIDINTGDSPEEIAKKIAEFKADRSHYDESGGFNCLVCLTTASELKDGAYTLAQFAITIDGAQPDIIANATNVYYENMKTQLAERYCISPDLVNIDVVYADGTDPLNPPTIEQTVVIYNQRIKDSYEQDLRENGYSLFDVMPVQKTDDDGNRYVYAKLIGGAELKVMLSGITYSPEIRDLILQNIEEYPKESVTGNPLAEQNCSGIPTPTSLPMYDQPPAPTLPMYNQPPAPTTLPMYDQPPAPESALMGPPAPSVTLSPPAPTSNGN